MRYLVIAALLVGSSASAQQPPAQMDARAAQAIIAGCVAHALGQRRSFAIAVVDAGGHAVATLRMDGNGFGMMDFALAKARAAAAWGFSTAGQEEGARATPGFARAPHVVTVGGGVPIWSADGRTRIGAAGASGGPPAEDAACVEAGILAAGLRTSRAG